MKYVFILLLVVLCYAQFVSSGGRRGGRRGGRGRLEKQISDLKEDVSCLMDDMKECKKEIKELNDKMSKLITMLAQSK